MINITNKLIHCTFESIFDNVKIKGEYRIDTDDNIITIEANLFEDTVLIGSFDVYKLNDDFGINKANIKLEDSARVDEIIQKFIDELFKMI